MFPRCALVRSLEGQGGRGGSCIMVFFLSPVLLSVMGKFEFLEMSGI